MSGTVATVISSEEPVALTPDITAALHAALAYLTSNQAAVTQAEAAVTAAQNAAISAEAAEDQIRALLAVNTLKALLTSLFTGLPTTEPSTPGQLWNNGNLLALSS